ncbi:hypothetical protein CCR75_001022 [Bremia lactucae]|uniref:Uncharacterized protein n=1 Tax=Bremia lactucae TaxID=4779 RepID=A0A976II15_BRELC|nr:hypothetical protein CCR75_001022 [Bremia lactucae]
MVGMHMLSIVALKWSWIMVVGLAVICGIEFVLEFFFLTYECSTFKELLNEVQLDLYLQEHRMASDKEPNRNRLLDKYDQCVAFSVQVGRTVTTYPLCVRSDADIGLAFAWRTMSCPLPFDFKDPKLDIIGQHPRNAKGPFKMGELHS